MDRAVEAKRILESPLWAEAFEGIRQRFLTQLLSETANEKATYWAKEQVLILGKVKSELESEIQTGELAARQLQDNKGEGQ